MKLGIGVVALTLTLGTISCGAWSEETSGMGMVMDAHTGEQVRDGIIVNIEWTLRKTDGSETRHWVQQRDPRNTPLYISPLIQMRNVDIPGWEVAADRAPMVRVYVKGYEDLPVTPWKVRSVNVLKVKKLPDTDMAYLKQMRDWRHEVDAALAANPVREDALRSQINMLNFFEMECRKLQPGVRKGICFEKESGVASYLEKHQDLLWAFAQQTPEGPREMRVVAMRPSAMPIQAASAAPANGRAVYMGGNNGSALGVANALAPAKAAPGSEPAPKAGGFSIKPSDDQ